MERGNNDENPEATNEHNNADGEEKICPIGKRYFCRHYWATITLILAMTSTVYWATHVYINEPNVNVILYILVVVSPILTSAGWFFNFWPALDSKVRGSVWFDKIIHRFERSQFNCQNQSQCYCLLLHATTLLESPIT